MGIISEALDLSPDFFPSIVLESSINPLDGAPRFCYLNRGLWVQSLLKYLFTTKVLLTQCPGREPVIEDVEVLM